jgi:hypothetical protein
MRRPKKQAQSKQTQEDEEHEEQFYNIDNEVLANPIRRGSYRSTTLTIRDLAQYLLYTINETENKTIVVIVETREIRQRIADIIIDTLRKKDIKTITASRDEIKITNGIYIKLYHTSRDFKVPERADQYCIQDTCMKNQWVSTHCINALAPDVGEDEPIAILFMHLHVSTRDILEGKKVKNALQTKELDLAFKCRKWVLGALGIIAFIYILLTMIYGVRK